MKPLGLILAGGQSKRLFPVHIPKPLLKVGGKSLLLLAVEKLAHFNTRIICNEKISKEIAKAFSDEGLNIPSFAVEPEGRDTAAAVGFGLLSAKAERPTWVAVLSADQWMRQTEKFAEFLKVVEAEVAAHPSALFVAGSPKNSKSAESHSAFGWIVPKKEKNSKSWAVKVFVEKPKGAALTKVRTQGGLINAGMFFGNYKTFVEAYEKLYPEVLDSKFPYANLKRLPIDKAIFEKFENVRVIPLPLEWEDLGTWKDWFDLVGKGQGSGGKLVRSKNVLISSDDGVEIYSFDNRDLAIVQSGKKILVVPLSKAKDLKAYLEQL